MATHFPLLFASILFTTIMLLPQSNSQKNDTFSTCNQSYYTCGTLTNITFPFWGKNRPNYCGSNDSFKLTCTHNQTTLIQIGSQKFNVLNIKQTSSTLKIVRTNLVNDICSSKNFTNISLNKSPFTFLPTVQNLTLFHNCSIPIRKTLNMNNFTCPNKHVFYVVESETQIESKFSDFKNCGVSFQVQVSMDGHHVWDYESGVDALRHGFDVKYDEGEGAGWSSQCDVCRESGGTCGTNQNDSSQFSCYCSGGTHAAAKCSHKSSKKNKVLKLVIGFIATGMLLPLIAVIICRNKAKIWKFILIQFSKITRNNQHIEAFLESQGPLNLKRYNYSDVKKMTDSFKVKLGEGGYGSVYKGKLLNGCFVAVKILNESKGCGEDFINEVASICKTSHVNVVMLLGFCLDGTKKALIYEFMSNGSLEKYIQNHNKEPEKTSTSPPSLSWENLHQIAIGIARGLEYLHKGCNTRILHFDIKPHNILLDEMYRPKISDFGLSKLSTKDESIISMSNARGTIGYVAPEVFNKSFGGVSHKSDVYSYGMMLLEMVGGRKNNVNIVEASCSSDLYFPHLAIYKKIENGNDLEVDDGVMSNEENEIAKKLTMVGLWCIQTIPSHRPTISKVIDMLEGSMECLEMPPKPVMFSPPRSMPEFSTSSKSLESSD